MSKRIAVVVTTIFEPCILQGHMESVIPGRTEVECPLSGPGRAF